MYRLPKINLQKYLLFALIMAACLFESFHPAGDLSIFLNASADLGKGGNIYTTLYSEWYHYYYDVVFALVLYPFTYLPYTLVKFLWLLSNVFFTWRIWCFIRSLLPLTLLNQLGIRLFHAFSFLIVLKFLRDNFHLAQVTILILFLLLEGLHQIGKGNKILGSSLLALGVTIKILPIVCLPYLCYRNEWKSCGFVILFCFALLLLPGFLIGNDYNLFLLSERWLLINPSNQEHILDTAERSFHSLTTLLATLFVENCGDEKALPLKRNIADISIENLNIIINSVRLLLAVSTLYFLQSKPFIAAKNNLQRLYEISYLCLVIPLIFPHQQHYAFFFVFPATTYLVFAMVGIHLGHSSTNEHRLRTSNRSVVFSLFVLVFFLLNSHFIVGTYRNLYDHYKTLTYGVLIVLVLLVYHKPDKLMRIGRTEI